MVHLAAEYFPYARTGGLAEAVAGLARFQSKAGSGAWRSCRSMRRRATWRVHSKRWASRSRCEVGPRTETARLLREVTPRRGARIHFIEHDGFFDREKLYGDAARRLPRQSRAIRLLCPGCPAALPRMVDGPVLLHAHDWHAALALAYLRIEFSGEPVLRRSPDGAVGAQRRIPGPLSRPTPWSDSACRGSASTGANWSGTASSTCSRAGLVLADVAVDRLAHPRPKLRTPSRRFRSAVRYRAMGDRFTASSMALTRRSGTLGPTTHIVAPYRPEDFTGKAACKARPPTALWAPRGSRDPAVFAGGPHGDPEGPRPRHRNQSLFALRSQFVFLGGGERRYEEALTEASAPAMPDRWATNTGFTDTSSTSSWRAPTSS